MSNYYESMAYHQDFLTGRSHIEIKKKKENGIKGKVTVSLMKAGTGEEINRSYTENLIPDIYFKDTFLRQFVSGIMGYGATRGCNNYSWFNYLYLTDSDKPEHSNEQRVMGNVIGYAHRNDPYTGNDSKVGMVNKGETSFEITDSKIKMNFVFDFPTHAANGTIESVYFCEASLNDKDYFYTGPAVQGREKSVDGDIYVYQSNNPKRFFAIVTGFGSATSIRFTSATKGFMIIDGKQTAFTQSTLIQFPDDLKGHWIYLPFDVTTNDILLWDQAVRLLNSNGEALVAVTSDSVKKYDGINAASIHQISDKDFNIIGCNYYTLSSESYIRIYRWSKVGVLLSFIDINMTQTFKDPDYSGLFTRANTGLLGVYSDGLIDIVGYTTQVDSQLNEKQYTNRWIQINTDGEVITDLVITPKMGNELWFGTVGINSGNINRRYQISDIYRTKNRVYLYYLGVQGGTSFWQCMTPTGNLLQAYRKYLSVKENYHTAYSILGTDQWVIRYRESITSVVYKFNLFLGLTSRPIGTHTRLAQSIEKTEANTMKVQYQFEIDLLTYGEDYY